MDCPKCGSANAEGKVYCGDCGKQLIGSAAPSNRLILAAAVIAGISITSLILSFSDKAQPTIAQSKSAPTPAASATSAPTPTPRPKPTPKPTLEPTPTPTPAPRPTRPPEFLPFTVDNSTFWVNAGRYDTDSFNVQRMGTLQGYVRSTNGKDFDFFICKYEEFENWANGGSAHTVFNPGRIVIKEFSVQLYPGRYVIVYSNKFSLLTPKQIEANITFNPTWYW